MGAKNACDYADISMTKLDHYIHEEDLKAKHGMTTPIVFERIRDDIFALFTNEDSIGKCYDLFTLFTITSASPSLTSVAKVSSSKTLLCS